VSTARELLDCLGRSALVRLIRERGLAPARENDERRKTLAHSYRGDVEALIDDLSRAELVEVFRQITFVVGDEELYLANPGKYRLDELRAFAIRAFAGRRVRIPGEFSPASELEDDDEYDVDEEPEGHDDEPEEPLDDGDQGDDEQEVDEPEGEGPGHPFRRLSKEWSRPRLIARVLRKLGRDVPERLRTARFQELIGDLRARGIEACLAEDPSCTVLADDADSPGIAAKLRLRLTGSWESPPDAGSMEARDAADRGAAARKAWETRRARQLADGGPPIVIQPGERPVSQRIPRPSDYNLAVLRLQFLTAVPSVERRGMTEWPGAYLEAATRGLELRPQELALLRALAAGLCLGNHSPYDAIPHLTQAMTASEWDQLLDDFVALNPFQPDFVRAIVEQIQPVTAPKSAAQTWRDAAPTPEDLRDSPETDRAQQPLAASGKRGPSTEPAKEPEANVRDLGALKGMFEDD
jgi:hypothetical protein